MTIPLFYSQRFLAVQPGFVFDAKDRPRKADGSTRGMFKEDCAGLGDSKKQNVTRTVVSAPV